MPKGAKKRAARKTELQLLTGRSQIAAFLGEPTSVVQRWSIGRNAGSSPRPPRRDHTRRAPPDPAWQSADYSLVSRSTTTSEVLCVRITASVLRSGDQRNPVIRSEVKFVIWWPGEPSSGCIQRFAAL